MAVLDWLQQLLGGGDPEAQGAAATSTAMMPAVNQWAQNVASGDYVRQGLPSTYDPNQSFAQNALNPNSLENALNVALGVGGGSGLGIKAYHGSPYDFKAFDASKIGTGEGAQAYGHGLYFADNPEVARSYRDMLRDKNISVDDKALLEALNTSSSEPGRALALEMLYSERSLPATYRRLAGSDPDYVAARSWLDANKGSITDTGPGKMYEVNINAEPDQFLNWDKPLSEQPPQVRSLFGPGDMSQDVGRTMHDMLARHYGGAEGASQQLQQAGIPGIRYLDQGSRGAGQGTSNYVVFDPSIIEILRKYGIIPPVAGAGLLGAADQQ